MVLMSKQLCTCITFFGTFLSLPFTKALLMRSSFDDVSIRWRVFLSLCEFLFGRSELNSRKKNCLRLTNWSDWNNREFSLKFTFRFGCRRCCWRSLLIIAASDFIFIFFYLIPTIEKYYYSLTIYMGNTLQEQSISMIPVAGPVFWV